METETETEKGKMQTDLDKDKPDSTNMVMKSCEMDRRLISMSSIFRCMGGLWKVASGTITKPGGERVHGQTSVRAQRTHHSASRGLNYFYDSPANGNGNDEKQCNV